MLSGPRSSIVRKVETHSLGTMPDFLRDVRSHNVKKGAAFKAAGHDDLGGFLSGVVRQNKRSPTKVAGEILRQRRRRQQHRQGKPGQRTNQQEQQENGAGGGGGGRTGGAGADVKDPFAHVQSRWQGQRQKLPPMEAVKQDRERMK